MRLLSLAAIIIAAGIAATAQAETVARAVGSFDAIDLAGAARLEITVGPAEMLTLEGDQALLREVATEVRSGTLHIGREVDAWRALDWQRQGLTIRISLPRLTALALHGSSRATIAGLAGERTDLALYGSNQVEAHGHLTQVALKIHGSARADLSDLAVEDAEVVVRGSGHAEVQPHRSLAATVRGNGRVTYAGNPAQVTADARGNGRIERR